LQITGIIKQTDYYYLVNGCHHFDSTIKK